MDRSISRRLDRVRRYTATDPSTVTVVALRSGTHSAHAPSQGLTDYFDFLTVSNGARFGIVDLFGLEMLPASQAGSQGAEWFRIGQVLYDPLLVHQHSGLVAVYDRLQGVTIELGVRFWDFLRHFILGSRYAELSPSPQGDRWYRVLSDLGMLEGVT